MADTIDPGTENGVYVSYRGMAMVTVIAAPGSKIHTRRVLGSDGYWYFIPPDAEVTPDEGKARTDDVPGPATTPVRGAYEPPRQPLVDRVMWRNGRFVRIDDVPLEEWD